jgi:bacillithiol system protein YtxJ
MDMHWIPLDSIEGVEKLMERSHEAPCLIFKHSTRCNISAIAKYRLEDDWAFENGELPAYYLDVIAQRAIAKQVAELFQVQHESPQVLLISEGTCIYDASHLDITVGEIKETLEQVSC